HPHPPRGHCRGAVLTWRPAAENDHVVIGHVGSSVPACSAIMYAAYQSCQFLSACPVRFSCSPCAASTRRSAAARSGTDVNDVTAASTPPGSRGGGTCRRPG